MKLTIESGGGGQDDILARAYIAAVVGPLRRPQGGGRQIILPAGNTPTILVNNSTGNRVLHVTLATVTPGAQTVMMSRDGSGGFGFSINLGQAGFVLYPGENLFGATNPSITVDVYTSAF